MSVSDHGKFKFVFSLLAVTVLTITSSIAYAGDTTVNCAIQVNNKTKRAPLKISQAEATFVIKKHVPQTYNLDIKQLEVLGKKDRIILLGDAATTNQEVATHIEEQGERLKMIDIPAPLTISASVGQGIFDKGKIVIKAGMNGNEKTEKISANSNQSVNFNLTSKLPYLRGTEIKWKGASFELSCTVHTTQESIEESFEAATTVQE